MIRRHFHWITLGTAAAAALSAALSLALAAGMPFLKPLV
jgi:hypothetical protein